MASGNEQQYIDGNVQIVPGSAVEAMRTYTVEEIESVVTGLTVDPAVGIPASFTLGTQIGIGIGGPAGDTYTLNTSAAPTKRKHTVVLEKRDRDGAAASAKWGVAQWRHTDDGFNTVPVKMLAAEVIQVGVRVNDYPSGATTDTNGQHFLDRWTHGIGENPTIASVANLAPGLKLKVTDANLWRAWSAVGSSRPCTVWLNSPETSADEAIYYGILESDGVDVFVDVPNWFGQTGAPSLVPGDYTVHVHGLTFSLKSGFDLTAQSTNSVDTYVVLAEYDVTAGTADFTPQTMVPTLQMLATAGVFGTNPIPNALRTALRAGCYLGNYEDTRDWNAVANVVVNSGVDPVTITFGAALLTTDEGRYFYAGPETVTFPPTTGRVCKLWQSGANVGNIATIAKSEATANYAVIAVAEPLTTDPTEHAVRLKVVPYPAPFSDFENRQFLHIWTFGFTTGTGVVAGVVPEDLSLKRGIADGTLFGHGNDASAGNFQSPIIEELVGAEALSVLLRRNVGVDYATTKFLEAVQVAAANRALKLWPVTGAGNLTAEGVSLWLGGASDYELRASEAAGTRTMAILAAAALAAQHHRTAGEADTAPGRLQVEDLHLFDTKTMPFMVPLPGAHGHTMPEGIGSTDAKVLWKVVDHDSFAVDGNDAANQTLFTSQFVDGWASVVGDCYTLRCSWEFSAVVGNALDYVRIYLDDTVAPFLIWDSAVAAYGGGGGAYTPGAGDVGFLQLAMHVNNNGAVGPMNVTYQVQSYNPAGPFPFGAPPVNEVTFTVMQTAALDFTKDVRLRMDAKWAAANAGQVLEVRHVEMTRERDDLWRYNGKDGWLLTRGNGRELRFDLPVEVTHGRKLVDVELFAGVVGGAAATCKIVLDLIEYNPATGVEASLLTAVVDVDGAGPGPYTLTCDPGGGAAPYTLLWDRRYYVKASTVQTTAGGDFYIRSVQGRVQINQM